MQKITPFLWFDRQAEEAMNHYVSIFDGYGKGGRIVNIQRYPETGLEGPMKGFEGKVLTGEFELAGQRFMALDGGPLFKPSNAVSFLVDCADQAEIDYFWDKLGEGGDPDARQCGWLKDKYGFSWQVIPMQQMHQALNEGTPEQIQRATHAMLQMQKLDIAALQKAHDGK
jgi:predicted 3-demethylubiquinone-9 3-methyltransferase (glyoxalase superfamily)